MDIYFIAGSHYNEDLLWNSCSAYEWDYQRLYGSMSAQPSPKLRQHRTGSKHSVRDEGVFDEAAEHQAGISGHRSLDKRSGSVSGAFSVTPNSPMLHPMPVIPAPDSVSSTTERKSSSSGVFTYYNGPSASSAPPGFGYPLF